MILKFLVFLLSVSAFFTITGRTRPPSSLGSNTTDKNIPNVKIQDLQLSAGLFEEEKEPDVTKKIKVKGISGESFIKEQFDTTSLDQKEIEIEESDSFKNERDTVTVDKNLKRGFIEGSEEGQESLPSESDPDEATSQSTDFLQIILPQKRNKSMVDFRKNEKQVGYLRQAFIEPLRACKGSEFQDSSRSGDGSEVRSIVSNQKNPDFKAMKAEVQNIFKKVFLRQGNSISDIKSNSYYSEYNSLHEQLNNALNSEGVPAQYCILREEVLSLIEANKKFDIEIEEQKKLIDRLQNEILKKTGELEALKQNNTDICALKRELDASNKTLQEKAEKLKKYKEKFELCEEEQIKTWKCKASVILELEQAQFKLENAQRKITRLEETITTQNEQIDNLFKINKEKEFIGNLFHGDAIEDKKEKDFLNDEIKKLSNLNEKLNDEITSSKAKNKELVHNDVKLTGEIAKSKEANKALYLSNYNLKQEISKLQKDIEKNRDESKRLMNENSNLMTLNAELEDRIESTAQGKELSSALLEENGKIRQDVISKEEAVENKEKRIKELESQILISLQQKDSVERENKIFCEKMKIQEEEINQLEKTNKIQAKILLKKGGRTEDMKEISKFQKKITTQVEDTRKYINEKIEKIDETIECQRLLYQNSNAHQKEGIKEKNSSIERSFDKITLSMQKLKNFENEVQSQSQQDVQPIEEYDTLLKGKALDEKDLNAKKIHNLENDFEVVDNAEYLDKNNLKLDEKKESKSEKKKSEKREKKEKGPSLVGRWFNRSKSRAKSHPKDGTDSSLDGPSKIALSKIEIEGEIFRVAGYGEFYPEASSKDYSEKTNQESQNKVAPATKNFTSNFEKQEIKKQKNIPITLRNKSTYLEDEMLGNTSVKDSLEGQNADSPRLNFKPLSKKERKDQDLLKQREAYEAYLNKVKGTAILHNPKTKRIIVPSDYEGSEEEEEKRVTSHSPNPSTDKKPGMFASLFSRRKQTQKAPEKTEQPLFISGATKSRLKILDNILWNPGLSVIKDIRSISKLHDYVMSAIERMNKEDLNKEEFEKEYDDLETIEEVVEDTNSRISASVGSEAHQFASVMNTLKKMPCSTNQQNPSKEVSKFAIYGIDTLMLETLIRQLMKPEPDETQCEVEDRLAMYIGLQTQHNELRDFSKLPIRKYKYYGSDEEDLEEEHKKDKIYKYEDIPNLKSTMGDSTRNRSVSKKRGMSQSENVGYGCFHKRKQSF